MSSGIRIGKNRLGRNNRKSLRNYSRFRLSNRSPGIEFLRREVFVAIRCQVVENVNYCVHGLATVATQFVHRLRRWLRSLPSVAVQLVTASSIEYTSTRLVILSAISCSQRFYVAIAAKRWLSRAFASSRFHRRATVATFKRRTLCTNGNR